MDISGIVKKAETSGFYRSLLNRGLGVVVPFNKPHKFRIVDIGPGRIKVKLPYIRRNLNHLKGLHACALATLAEMTSGFLLISQLNPKKYRLILQKLDMEYHYQAKGDAFAEYSMEEGWLHETVIEPLEHEDSVLLHCDVSVKDLEGKLLATGVAYWQVKRWNKVKTRV